MRQFPLSTGFILSALGGICLVFVWGSGMLSVHAQNMDTLTGEPKALDTANSTTKSVEISMMPHKQIFSRREGLMVSFVFKALEPARICFEKDPISQFQFKIIRSGKGKLNLAPLVVQDTRRLFGQRPKIFHLNSGDTHTYRLNLKRIHFLSGEKWMPGDYSVEASFRLCEQRENNDWQETDVETSVPVVRPARFMIMN